MSATPYKRKSRFRTVSFKLMFAVSAIMLVVIGLLTWFGVNSAGRRAEVVAVQNLIHLYDDFIDEIKADTVGAAALSVSLADRADVQTLFLAEDREGLLDLLTPVFNNLSANYGLVHLYVHQPNGIVFVRVHNPAKFGDDITYRRTAAAVLESKKTEPGVEIGPGRLGIRSVSPMFRQGEFTGMVEVGFDYDQPFLELFAKDHGADYTLWVSKEAAAPAGLGPQADAPASPSADLFFYASTTPIRLPVSREVYEQVLAEGKPQTLFVTSHSGDKIGVLIAPLQAYGDRIIGIVEISQSQASAISTLQREQLLIFVIAFVVAAAGLSVVRWALTRVVLTPLEDLTIVARRQLRGDLTARAAILSDDEFGELGTTLNTLNHNLGDMIENQDTIITRRTEQLQLTLDVARHLASILEYDQLLQEVVNLIHDRFNLYHVHIYLMDDSRENLVLEKGYGETGEIMKGKGHAIAVTTTPSIVARAARFGDIVRVDNVQAEKDWLPNPFLPETRSEMAVPIKLRNEVLGILDMQSAQVGALGVQETVTVSVVADYLAVAIHNARRFETTTQALAEARKIQQMYMQAGWQSALLQQKTSFLPASSTRLLPLLDSRVAESVK